jgi:hypothetical protein
MHASQSTRSTTYSIVNQRPNSISDTQTTDLSLTSIDEIATEATRRRRFRADESRLLSLH